MVTHSDSKAAVDSRWFKNTLEDQSKTQRQLAKHMGCEPAAVTRMLQGSRKMSAEEASPISKFFNVGIEEVMQLAT